MYQFHVMFSMLKKKKLYLSYVLKHKFNRAKQVNLLTIPNRKEWHYLAVKKTISIVKRNNF